VLREYFYIILNDYSKQFKKKIKIFFKLERKQFLCFLKTVTWINEIFILLFLFISDYFLFLSFTNINLNNVKKKNNVKLIQNLHFFVVVEFVKNLIIAQNRTRLDKTRFKEKTKYLTDFFICCN